MKKKYYYKGEVVEEEIWQWEAVYFDNTSLKQFDDNGIFHKFDEIDWKKLLFIKFFSKVYPNYFVFHYENGMKMTYFYYRYCFNAKTENERKFTVYCFEYEVNNDKRCLMILPNGELLITSNPEDFKLEI